MDMDPHDRQGTYFYQLNESAHSSFQRIYQSVSIISI